MFLERELFMKLKEQKKKKKQSKIMSAMTANPTRIIVSSFAVLIFIGAFLLTLPMSSRSGQGLDLVSALFTATSATCVTGLVVVDTYSHFTMFGQVVILCLIQMGGLGLVAFATFFNLAIRKRVGFKTLYLAQESTSGYSMYNTKQLIKLIFSFTFSIEILGALLLMIVFVPELGAHGIFVSIFLSVSAYCNAGFDVLGFKEEFSSLTHYYDNPFVLIVISILVISGGLGFIVWQDLIFVEELERKKKVLATKKDKANENIQIDKDGFKTITQKYKRIRFRGKNEKLMLHTKIVLFTSSALLVVGTLLVLAFEWNNPLTIGDMSVGNKVLNSFFQSVTCRTAGFNTIDNASMVGITKLLTIILMLIGAAPGGTGGGIKVTTVYVLMKTIVCVMQGKDETIIDNRKVDKSVVYKALAVIGIALMVISFTTSIIYFTSHNDGITFRELDAVFESVSAFGTAGLSNGVTGVANTPSRIILMLTMFVGRVGPVSLALSLALRPLNKSTVYPEAKIMVG